MIKVLLPLVSITLILRFLLIDLCFRNRDDSASEVAEAFKR